MKACANEVSSQDAALHPLPPEKFELSIHIKLSLLAYKSFSDKIPSPWVRGGLQPHFMRLFNCTCRRQSFASLITSKVLPSSTAAV
jgi:hypothetical protein